MEDIKSSKRSKRSKRRGSKSREALTLKPLEYENLVIEGGGVLGIAYLGALKELYADKSIEKAKCFVGSSVGSLVASILAVRTSYETLEKIIFDLNLKNYKDRTWLFEDIPRLLSKYGFYKGDKLLAFIQKLFLDITGNSAITFKQVYEKYGTKLVITGTNISKGNIAYFSLENSPDMQVALANRISCSVPYFFQSVLHEGSYYVDGGVLNNYPIDYFDANNQVNSKTLGLKLVSESDINQEKGSLPSITGIKSFTENLIDTVMSQSMKIHVKSDDWKRTVCIFTGDLSFINFDLSEEEKTFLINEGSKAIKAYKTQS